MNDEGKIKISNMCSRISDSPLVKPANYSLDCDFQNIFVWLNFFSILSINHKLDENNLTMASTISFHV